jgi:hypothetical protein
MAGFLADEPFEKEIEQNQQDKGNSAGAPIYKANSGERSEPNEAAPTLYERIQTELAKNIFSTVVTPIDIVNCGQGIKETPVFYPAAPQIPGDVIFNPPIFANPGREDKWRKRLQDVADGKLYQLTMTRENELELLVAKQKRAIEELRMTINNMYDFIRNMRHHD